jgi:predicted proteasome-type protease
MRHCVGTLFDQGPVCYRRDALPVARRVSIGSGDADFAMIRKRWGEQLRRVFQDQPNPAWQAEPTPGVGR